MYILRMENTETKEYLELGVLQDIHPNVFQGSVQMRAMMAGIALDKWKLVKSNSTKGETK